MADERDFRGSRSGPRRRRPFSGGGPRRSRVCYFCTERIKHIDYKDTDVLRRFVTERGQIRSRRKTSLCAKHQRRLAAAVKRARFMALLPYTGEHVRLYGR